LNTNLEAAEEISRQMRLRDLAGLIVIDFIDMDERRNNASVERLIKDKLSTDRARIQVGRISGFGLLEMSRQRLRPGMLEATTQPCVLCHGTGLIRSKDSLALTILRQIEEEGTRRTSKEVCLTAPVEIINYLMNEKREHISNIESRYGLAVRLQADALLISPDFTLEKLKVTTRNIVVNQKNVVSMGSIDLSDLDEVSEVSETSEIKETMPPPPADETDQIKKRRRRRRRNGKSRDIDSESSDSKVAEKVVHTNAELEGSQDTKLKVPNETPPKASIEKSNELTSKLPTTANKLGSEDKKVRKKRTSIVNKPLVDSLVKTDDIKDIISSEVTSSVLQKKRIRKVVANIEKPTDEAIKSPVKSKPEKAVKKAVKKAIIKDKKSDDHSQITVLLEKEKKAPVKKAPVKKVKNSDLEVNVSVESKEPKRKGWWSTK
jgi:ribonuclease E